VVPALVRQLIAYVFPVAGLAALTMYSGGSLPSLLTLAANARNTLAANPQVVRGPALMFWSHAVYCTCAAAGLLGGRVGGAAVLGATGPALVLVELVVFPCELSAATRITSASTIPASRFIPKPL
jgi:hypothetical protein